MSENKIQICSKLNLKMPVFITLVLSVLLVTGCMTPKGMEVRSGTDPKYQDDDVRFRTTYYFRVFDFCLNTNTKIKKIQTDSLYRFRMTGKAGSLFNKVHFESGTLLKSEIDPFGSNVKYNEDTGSFQYISKDEAKKKANKKSNQKEYERLIKLSQQLQKDEETLATGSFQKFQTYLNSQIDALNPPNASGNSSNGNSNGNSSSSNSCSNGTPTQRGFQILGPEGWRTFNQEERLLIAMSSNGKPLIGAMKELSGKILQTKSNQAESLLPLVKERLAISEANRTLDRLETSPPKKAEDIITETLKSFQKEDQ